MVFDEATSSLDATTERQIQIALDAATKGRTTFIIAHRLSTIRNADRIFVFDHGEIVESGTFDELIEKRGRLAALASAQFMAERACRHRSDEETGLAELARPSTRNDPTGDQSGLPPPPLRYTRCSLGRSRRAR